jgi:hypothetical protein
LHFTYSSAIAALPGNFGKFIPTSILLTLNLILCSREDSLSGSFSREIPMRLSISASVAAALICIGASLSAAAPIGGKDTPKKTKADCEYEYGNCYFKCDRTGTDKITLKKNMKRIRNCQRSCKTKRDLCVAEASDGDGNDGGGHPTRTFTPIPGKDFGPAPAGNILDPGPRLGHPGPAPTGTPSAPPPVNKIN